MTRTLTPAVTPAGAAALARAAHLIAVPKAAPADSFVLHAPLELIARVGLLEHVDPRRFDDAVGMIEWLAEQYHAVGEPVAEPRLLAPMPSAQAAQRLVAAIASSDLDEVDALAAALLPTLSAREIVGLLGEAIVPSLAAAGHAPIGLSLLGRVRAPLPTTLLRGALRGIASRPEWRVDWYEAPGIRAREGDASGLHSALRTTPQLGRPGSDFIHPLMSQVQDNGVAADLLAPLLADRFDVAAAGRTLTRMATWSMVHDDPAQAPYGWTHSLTMPQAVMSLAGAGVRPRTALAVAGTFMVGFRAAHGTVTPPEVIEPGPAAAATAQELATAAAVHEDAHLVKFTLACLHAAEDDPSHRALALNAAAHLVEWWSHA
jgi:hypothetical protein